MTLKLKSKTTEMLVIKKHSITLIMLKEKEEKELKSLLNKLFHPNKKKIKHLNKSRKTQRHSMMSKTL